MEGWVVDLAHELAKDHLSCELEQVELIVDGGRVNEVYLLSTDRPVAVLRVNDAAEHPRFVKERWCAETAEAYGVPGPKVLADGVADDSAYMLLEFVAGTNGRDILPSADLWRTLGKYLRRVHDVPVFGFGETIESI